MRRVEGLTSVKARSSLMDPLTTHRSSFVVLPRLETCQNSPFVAALSPSLNKATLSRAAEEKCGNGLT